MKNTQQTENQQNEETKEEMQDHQPNVEASQPEEKPVVDNSAAKIAELELQVVQLKDQLLRTTAEFENYRRRTAAESLALTKYAAERVLLQILPTLDDFTRSIKIGTETIPEDTFFQGVKMIYGKFLKSLEAQGLKEMEVLGKEFNVEYHDAMMQIPRAGVAPHTILEEIERGYLLHDKVLRHAKVVVSTEPTGEQK